MEAARQTLENSGDTSAVAGRAVVQRSKCTGCGLCRELCPHGAIRVTYIANVAPERCVGCGVCVENCPVRALSLRFVGQR